MHEYFNRHCLSLFVVICRSKRFYIRLIILLDYHNTLYRKVVPNQ